MRTLRMIFGLLALVGVAVALNVVVLKEDMSTASVLVPLVLGLAAGVAWLILRILTVSERYGRGRTLYGVNSAISTLVFFGICVVAYAFASHWDSEWDLTQEGRRELAPQTTQVLQGLSQDVQVVGFFVDADDAIMDASRDKTERFLNQARAYSPRLKVEFVDPVSSPERLAEFGLEKERISTQGTVVIKSGRNQKVVQLSGVTARLEERDFTNALINVVRKSQPKIYFLQGHNERDPGKGPEADPKRGALSFKSRLEAEGYLTDVLTLSLVDPKIPEDCSLLVANGPELPFRPQEVTVLQDYMDKGGRALFMLDPLFVPLASLPAWFAEKYGIVVQNDVLLNSLMQKTPSWIYLLPDTGKITAQLTSRPWPEEFPGCFGKEHPITRGFDKEMVLQEARTVDLAEKLPANVAGSVILRALPYTYAETDLELLLKGQRNRDPDEPEGYPSVAVAVTAKTDTSLGDTDKAKDARLVVIGDGDLSSNEGMLYLGHLNFLMNSVAWLTESEELIAIRPTGKEDPPIILTAGEEQAIAWISTLGLLQAVAVVGIGVHLLRRKYQ